MHSSLPFGYGDGGGGPSRDYVEYALRQKDLEGGVKVKMEGPREFFEEMQGAGRPRQHLCGRALFQRPPRNLYLPGHGKEEQQKMRACIA